MQDMQRLLDIMAQLRDPETGCPWDIKQTYASIVPYTLEEAYEVADAIGRGDMAELRQELGDLLFQVVFYSQIAKEQGYFDFNQVVQSINDKMLRRHPHVFAGAGYTDDESLRQAWEQTKAVERGQKAGQDNSQLAGVARALPALERAHKLQKRAANVGFDWNQVQGAIDKTYEELSEVEEALAGQNEQHITEELGDLLFAVVNIVRLAGQRAEHTLRAANDKFERRFRRMEQVLAAAGHTDLKQVSLEGMQKAWEQVKQEERVS